MLEDAAKVLQRRPRRVRGRVVLLKYQRLTLLASSWKCRCHKLLQKLLVLVGIQCAVYLRQNANVGARKCSPEHNSAATEAPGLSLGDLLTQVMPKVPIEVRTIQVKLLLVRPEDIVQIACCCMMSVAQLHRSCLWCGFRSGLAVAFTMHRHVFGRAQDPVYSSRRDTAQILAHLGGHSTSWILQSLFHHLLSDALGELLLPASSEPAPCTSRTIL